MEIWMGVESLYGAVDEDFVCGWDHIICVWLWTWIKGWVVMDGVIPYIYNHPNMHQKSKKN